MKRIYRVIIFVLVLLLIIIYRFNKYYSISCELYANSGIKSILGKSVNHIISEEISNDEYRYEDITEIIRDENNAIKYIAINSSLINELANEVAVKILDSIENNQFDFGVPLGNAFGSKMFSGKGPKFKVKIVPLGSVDYVIDSELISGGVNQTLHRITINYNFEINCLAPFSETVITMNNTLILAETVIVGEVPNYILSAK